jgi:hypothetical protein
MLRRVFWVLLFAAGSGLAQDTTDLSGTWTFSHANDQFRGWIVLKQSGDILRGTWHTSYGKSEPDDQVTARVDGENVTLWRFIGSNRQSFTLRLSQDGNRLDGFGEGFFLNHTDLSMWRQPAKAVPTAAPVSPAGKETRSAPLDLSGPWVFTHDHGRFQGTISLEQEGSELHGTWHTTKGKSEPDDPVSARIEGRTVTLWRFIGDAQQVFVLTLSPDRSRLDGFGDGFFLNHTDLSLLRITEAVPSHTPTK